jgi:hypothetical protein
MSDDFFKIDMECHLIGDLEPIKHFPGVQMWWRAVENIKRPLITGAPTNLLLDYLKGTEEWEMQKDSSPEAVIRAMDKYGVDIACLLPESMMDTTGYTSRWCTNGDMAKVVESNPDRFLLQPNLPDQTARGEKRHLGDGVLGEGAGGQGLQVLLPRGHPHERSGVVAVLREGAGTQGGARLPYRHVLGSAGQEQVLPPGAA